jgi:hypothetical protein
MTMVMTVVVFVTITLMMMMLGKKADMSMIKTRMMIIMRIMMRIRTMKSWMTMIVLLVVIGGGD